ncbi:MAG: hypothetical protein Q7S46_01930 [Gallionella sp.]|nr:hypothetical protein [Gallionella sp.]
MESSEMGSAPASFVRQMWDNKMLLLTVFLAVCAAAYFGLGLFFLLRH